MEEVLPGVELVDADLVVYLLGDESYPVDGTRNVPRVHDSISVHFDEDLIG
ncbi:hypothetical protein ES703_109218 [subsurface metagenome]